MQKCLDLFTLKLTFITVDHEYVEHFEDSPIVDYGVRYGFQKRSNF